MAIFDAVTARVKPLSSSELEEVFDQVFTPRYTISDIGITHRWITHWEKEGLLIHPKEQKSEKWRKFNAVEFVWLRLIVEMRKFKIPFTIIEKVKQMTDRNDPTMKNLAAIGRAIAETANPEVKNVSNLYDQFSIWEKMILDAVLMKTRYSILINNKGEYVPMIEEYLIENLKNPSLLEFFRGNHLSLSITNCMVDLYKQTKEESLLNLYKLISNQEREVLELLKQDDLVHAEIVYSKEHKIDLIRLKKHEQIDLYSRVKENVLNNGYQSITLKTANGKVVHCEKTITHRFK